jgi:phospholipid/cholesterol/gamma-HCH transport system permease protein
MTATTDSLTVQTKRTGETFAIALIGRLDASTLGEAWERAVAPAKEGAKTITVDAGKITYCDGAGLGLFAELRRVAASNGGELRFENMSEELRRLVSMSLLQDPAAGSLAPPAKMSFITEFGKRVADLYKDQIRLIEFIGAMTAALGWAVAPPRRVRYGDMLRVARKAGADALPVVMLLGGLVGIILSFQMADPLERYGAKHLIPNIVSFGLIRELGPLITAIILAGRSGAAFAAEIGTMKVTEELAALETLGLEPVRFLVVPRVLAAVIVTPLLSAFNIFAGLAGSCVILMAMDSANTFTGYVSVVQQALAPHDLIGGLFKSMVFGLIVAAIGCLRGTQTKSGPGAVGDSTTRAVVSGIVLTIIADAVFGTIYYRLGI